MRLLLAIFISITCFNAFAGYWDYEINQFDKINSESQIPSDPVLFIGSSTIRLWDTDKFFNPAQKVINRGFGGSQVKDILNYYPRLVTQYSPKVVVLYSGDNDLDFGKPVSEVFNDFNNLIGKLQVDLNAPIIWLLPKKAPNRKHIWAKIDVLNSLITQKYSNSNGIRLVDLNSLLGLPTRMEEFYSYDGIHMNDAAYKIISEIIRPDL